MARAGWGWNDEVDAPLGEEAERYRVEVLAGQGVLRSVETGAPQWDYDAAMRTADIGATAISVRQVGTYGLGRAAQISL